MKILVLGGGGREHAMCWRLLQDGHQLFVAPGNPGTEREAGCVTNLPDLNLLKFEAIQSICTEYSIDLVVPGGENLIALGVADFFKLRNVSCCAPSQIGSQLESSKKYAKEFFYQYGIPTARYAAFDEHNIEKAVEYVKSLGGRVAIKADGLAAGKGVVVTQTVSDAVSEVRRMLSGDTVGAAGEKVVIEEFLTGEEVSFTVLTDGDDYAILPSSQDHKARDCGDSGPNTGGMGACSPATIFDSALQKRVVNEVLRPVLRGLKSRNIDYRGVLYFGLMIDGPKISVLEINCRLGDPETQVILPRINGDFGQCLKAVADKKLGAFLDDCPGVGPDNSLPQISNPTLGIVLASAGYPGTISANKRISLPKVLSIESTDSFRYIFHAGTALGPGGDLHNVGGRVLSVVCAESSLLQAQKSALEFVQQVELEGSFYREDIGHKSIAHEQKLSNYS